MVSRFLNVFETEGNAAAVLCKATALDAALPLRNGKWLCNA